jgi:hypothetical protein
MAPPLPRPLLRYNPLISDPSQLHYRRLSDQAVQPLLHYFPQTSPRCRLARRFTSEATTQGTELIKIHGALTRTQLAEGEYKARKEEKIGEQLLTERV